MPLPETERPWRPISLLLALTVALACSEPDEPREPTAPDEATETSEPTAPTAPTAPDEPRAPAGAREASCDGASDDPEQIDLFVVGASEGDLEGSIRGLEALAGAHPGSATARVKLGELLLRTDPPQAVRAQTWFGRALALHDEGCTLGHRDLWAALEGAALSRMMQGDYAGALPFLRRSSSRWPGVPGTRYNLACALCQTGDVDGCARELTRLFDGPTDVPEFLHEQRRPAGHYARMARRDPDLAPLREDRDRFEAILAGR